MAINKKTAKIIYILTGVLAAFVVLNSFLIWSAADTVDARVALAKEAAKPPLIGIIQVMPPTACKECYPLDAFVSYIEKQKINLTSERTVYAGSNDAAGLPYVSKLPALVVSGELDKSADVSSLFTSMGFVRAGDYLVLDNPSGPYFDLASSKVVGKVSMVMLDDASCKNCYNVSVHRMILYNYGVLPDPITTLDVSSPEGAALVSKYNITKAPTFILSPEASVYSSLQGIWPQVGSVESDGYYVFRAVANMGNYTNLTTG